MVIYVRRRRKRKSNSPAGPVHEFWNNAYEEFPVKGQPLQPPDFKAPPSKQDEVSLDDMKEYDEAAATFLKHQFENPMFESNA